MSAATDFEGYVKAQGYNPDLTMVCSNFGPGDLRGAFDAGMQAARDLAAAGRPAELRALVRELIGGIVSGAWAMRGADRRLLRIAEEAGIEPPAILRLQDRTEDREAGG